MRRCAQLMLAALLIFRAADAEAAEKGVIIRASSLLAQPFIDAAHTGTVTPAQPVVIIERRGAWANVQAGDKSGWVRLLNVRLAAAAAVSGIAGSAKPAPAARPTSLTSMMRTGSSGRTVTTGVKGMDEENIRNATPDYAELALLDTQGIDVADAQGNAIKTGLQERTVDYLDKKKRAK